jgi:K+-transporting ATPase A subunit
MILVKGIIAGVLLVMGTLTFFLILALEPIDEAFQLMRGV